MLANSKSTLVSIITVCFNSQNTIKETLLSVNNQSYNHIEHIFIDANSIDSTVDIIKKYSSRENTIISEPDNGIYDAMNKGIKISNGEIIFILNSDDIFDNNNVVENVVRIFNDNPKVDMVYGSIKLSSSNDISLIRRVWIPTKFQKNSFKLGWHPPHPGFIARKKCYIKYGFFDISYKTASDFDLLLRFFEIYNLNSYRTEHFISIQRGGGTSMGFRGIKNGLLEIYDSFKKNNIELSFLTYMFKRYTQKIIQMFK